ncbi:DUF2897 family protein [Aliagarivorans marinus]|uniref:DUF2897 family protein n=1 Tax=Aliagarivorans marinus TaxID=561965 RepID=UPI00041E79FA|nr:DUF2897 family protein [Aliagarivorans marinus]
MEEPFSLWQALLIIVVVIGVILSNIMALRRMGGFRITPELKKKIQSNNQKADDWEKDDWDKDEKERD